MTEQIASQQRLDVRTLPLLTYDQRKKVREKARDELVGNKPTLTQYKNESMSEYPAWYNYLVLTVALIALLATGSVSALRIQTVGSELTCEMSAGRFEGVEILGIISVCNYTGIAMFLMAESLAFLFPLLAGLLAHDKPIKWMMYSAAVLSMMLALVFNYYMVQPHVAYEAGDWPKFAVDFLEWLLPPLFTLLIALGFERHIMKSFEDRKEMAKQYKTRVSVWEKSYDNPEAHERWWNVYPSYLRDELHRYYINILNLEKKVIDSITGEEWKALIKREIRMDHLKIDPNEFGSVDKKLNDTAKAELVEGDRWVAVSEQYDWRSPVTYASQKRALSAARRYEETQGLTQPN